MKPRPLTRSLDKRYQERCHNDRPEMEQNHESAKITSGLKGSEELPPGASGGETDNLISRVNSKSLDSVLALQLT